MINEHKLGALFYLLVRDSVPAGELIAMVERVRPLDKAQFTNPHILALAQDLVNRLKETNESIPERQERAVG